jgi:leucine dehydrogenase
VHLSLFEQMSRHDYGELHLATDAETGLRAIIALHDTRLGPAIGGCRFIPYASEEAAIIDALRLAQAMTSKAALARLPHGGGKAVIMRPTEDFDREAMLRRYARFVDGLGGRYVTTEDSGTSPQDMQVVRSVTRHVCGFDEGSGGSGDPSPFTALGVRRGIEACVKVALGRDDLQGVHVAVQGVGNVGHNLCRELAAQGARLTIADVRDSVVQQVAAEVGAETAPCATIHGVECDVYAPCALGGALNDRTIPQLRCPVVAGAANNQLAGDENGVQLMQRGILYAPDYAINAGGLINVAQEVKGYDADAARERTLQIYDTIFEICQRARSEGRPTHEVADRMVREILSAA